MPTTFHGGPRQTLLLYRAFPLTNNLQNGRHGADQTASSRSGCTTRKSIGEQCVPIEFVLSLYLIHYLYVRRKNRLLNRLLFDVHTTYLQTDHLQRSPAPLFSPHRLPPPA